MKPERQGLIPRILAVLIDGLAITVLTTLVLFILKLPWLPPFLAAGYFYLEVVFAYTPGKRIMKLIVLDEDGHKASFENLKKRWLLKAGIGAATSFLTMVLVQLQLGSVIVGILQIPAFVIAVGCLAILTPKRQTLYDRVSGTAVFRKKFASKIDEDVEISQKTEVLKNFFKDTPIQIWNFIKARSGIFDQSGKFSIRGLGKFIVRLIKGRTKAFLRGFLIGAGLHFFAVSLSGGYDDVDVFPTNFLVPTINVINDNPLSTISYPIAILLWTAVAALISYWINKAKSSSLSVNPGRALSSWVMLLISTAAYLTGLPDLIADDGGFAEWAASPGEFGRQGGPQLLGQSIPTGIGTGIGNALGNEASETSPIIRPSGTKKPPSKIKRSPTSAPTLTPGTTPAQVVDTKLTSGPDALNRLKNTYGPVPGTNYVKVPTNWGGGIKGGGFTPKTIIDPNTGKPIEVIDPTKPVTIIEDWPHASGPPTQQWVDDPTQLQNAGLQPGKTKDGRPTTIFPKKLPNHISGIAGNTEPGVDENGNPVDVFTPDDPAVISQWPPGTTGGPMPTIRPTQESPTPTVTTTPTPTDSPTVTTSPTPTVESTPEPTAIPTPSPTPSPEPKKPCTEEEKAYNEQVAQIAGKMADIQEKRRQLEMLNQSYENNKWAFTAEGLIDTAWLAWSLRGGRGPLDLGSNVLGNEKMKEFFGETIKGKILDAVVKGFAKQGMKNLARKAAGTDIDLNKLMATKAGKEFFKTMTKEAIKKIGPDQFSKLVVHGGYKMGVNIFVKEGPLFKAMGKKGAKQWIKSYFSKNANTLFKEVKDMHIIVRKLPADIQKRLLDPKNGKAIRDGFHKQSIKNLWGRVADTFGTIWSAIDMVKGVSKNMDEQENIRNLMIELRQEVYNLENQIQFEDDYELTRRKDDWNFCIDNK